VAVASAKGYRVGVKGTTIVYPGARMSDSDSLQVSSAGLQAQWLITEGVFYHRQEEGGGKPTNFEAGLVCAHLGITVAYLTVLRDHPSGDLTGVSEATGIRKETLGLAVAVPAALDAWRLMGHDVPEWAPWASRVAKGWMIGVIWAF